MFVCPFPTDPKYWKIRGVFFSSFFFFFFVILSFAFLNKNVEKKNVRQRCQFSDFYLKSDFFMQRFGHFDWFLACFRPFYPNICAFQLLWQNWVASLVRIYSNCPKKALSVDIMECNPQHQYETNAWALHAQECTHMNKTWLHFFCVQIKKKKKKGSIYRPNFQVKRANKPFYFLGLGGGHSLHVSVDKKMLSSNRNF